MWLNSTLNQFKCLVFSKTDESLEIELYAIAVTFKNNNIFGVEQNNQLLYIILQLHLQIEELIR